MTFLHFRFHSNGIAEKKHFIFQHYFFRYTKCVDNVNRTTHDSASIQINTCIVPTAIFFQLVTRRKPSLPPPRLRTAEAHHDDTAEPQR